MASHKKQRFKYICTLLLNMADEETFEDELDELEDEN
jgi:hypothetical protein